jgi:hypothetical protein
VILLDCWDIRVLDIVLAYVNDELHCSTVMKFWIFWSVFVILNVILLCIGNIALSLHVVRLCLYYGCRGLYRVVLNVRCVRITNYC